ncbi:MAG: glycosyltransferase family 4 protein [Dehalococcoidales bacterium]|nr:glycosyltransferase family 4 protein [Dehalococcoidales bacterium]
MKIALVSPYDFAYPGGVVNHISCLEHHLTRMGHEVKIIAPASRSVVDFGERFIPVGKPRSLPASGSVARITISPWIATKVKQILEREHFDIIHLHEPFMPMLCTTVLRLTETPAVGTFHASGGKPWYNICTPVGKFFLKKWYRKLDAKIAVSPPALGYISKYFPGEYTILPNGIDTNHFHPDVAPLDEFNDGKLNILFVGRLEKRKGVDYLLDAYRMLKPDFPNTRLIIVGPGVRLRHKYEKRVAKNRLTDVVFRGYVSFDDLPRYYKSATVVCAPATGWESFGIVLLEAMATNKPLVASNIEGYATVVSDGEDGLLVPPRNSVKLAEALRRVLTDPALQQKLAAHGREKALRYDWNNITHRLVEVYQKAVLQKSATHKDTRIQK